MFVLFVHTTDIDENAPLISQELVDLINNDPRSTFRAFLNPKWAKKSRADIKRVLSPIRQAPISHGSARPIGYYERFFTSQDKRFLSGTCSYSSGEGPTTTVHHKLCDEFTPGTKDNPHIIKADTDFADLVQKGTLYFPVYDISTLCSSWAPAVTSALTSSLWRWTPKKDGEKVFNLSLLFILDCDILMNHCMERTPLSSYEQFWRRYIPPQGNWDPKEKDTDYSRTPSISLTQECCSKYNACYPGINPTTPGVSCQRKMVLTGVCEPGSNGESCPIYFLYNWRWMKSQIAEIGPITSTILVYDTLFTYSASDTTKDVYSYTPTEPKAELLGMLDVTIIGWGQTKINMSLDPEIEKNPMKQRWWYVIPHLGQEPPTDPQDFSSLPCSEFTEEKGAVAFNKRHGGVPDVIDPAWGVISSDDSAKFQFSNVVCTKASGGAPGAALTGVIKFNRRYDECNIESQAVGAVPHNFIPRPFRSPRPTWSAIWELD